MNEWNKIKRKGLGEVPQAASENIKSPETAPSDKRISGRTEQLNLKVTREFKKQLKIIAAEKGWLMIEVLEKAMEVYKKSLFAESGSLIKHNKKENHSLTETKAKIPKPKPKTPPQQLNRFIKISFICNNCYRKFIRDVVYSLATDLDQIDNYPTYCSNCKETIEIPETCSFRERNEQTNQYTPCNKPLFDKKKQLCRSHNRQVRNKFNEFTKDMSVSSMAAWEMQWEQSGDWRYFWGLGGDE